MIVVDHFSHHLIEELPDTITSHDRFQPPRHDTNAATLRFLAESRPSYAGVRVLELGAGAGVIGLALSSSDVVVVVVVVLLLLLLLLLH